MTENKPILIVGLGNPGPQYAKTRHNVGFMAIDTLAGDGAIWKREKNALITRIANSDGTFTIFAKPQTFMNLSGISVLALMTFYKIPIENVVVIHDDMDIKLGDFRKKVGGSSAGHNGLKSIDKSIGKDYARIRIGVDHPPTNQIDPADWVLGKFNVDEMKYIKNVIKNLQID